MPEPDFDQLTVDLAARVGRGDILPHIKEQLRQVWNARGAADTSIVHTARETDDDYHEDPEASIERKIRSLDR